MPRKTKPWAVILTTASVPIRTEHRSKPEAYRKVAAERAAIDDGSSRVERIRVEFWQPDYGSWALYEIAYPAE